MVVLIVDLDGVLDVQILVAFAGPHDIGVCVVSIPRWDELDFVVFQC